MFCNCESNNSDNNSNNNVETSNNIISLYDIYSSNLNILAHLSKSPSKMNEAFLHEECKSFFDNFSNLIKLTTYDICKSSKYKNRCESLVIIDQLVSDGKLTKNYVPVTVPQNVLNENYEKVDSFTSDWEDEKLDTNDFDLIFNSLDVSNKFELLYELITYPFSNNTSLETYKHLCQKLFDLLDQYPYLMDYDAILEHPIVCELASQTSYDFFNPHVIDNSDQIKLRDYFIRELILRQSELLLHVNKYGNQFVELL